jgi:hypothetical protein
MRKSLAMLVVIICGALWIGTTFQLHRNDPIGQINDVAVSSHIICSC